MATLFKGKLETRLEDFGAEDKVVSYGSTAFATTGTSVEVTVACAIVECGLLTIRDGGPVANDLLSHDATVTSNAVTVFRPAGTTSGLTFDYFFIGSPSVVNA